MSVALTPYLNFSGTAREAMEFYKSVLGGELSFSTFGEGMGTEGPEKDNIMHGQLETEGLTLFGSDAMGGKDTFSGFSVSLSGDDAAKLRGWYEGLAAGGTVVEPLVKAPWGDEFGMLQDKYGVSWMVNITAPAA